MRPFRPSLFRHRAFPLALAESTDADAGVVEGFPSPGATPLPCRVRLIGSRQELAADQEVGITRAEVAFPADPGLAQGDRLLWGTRVLRAIAPAQARDADGVLWVVSCELVD